MQSYQKIITTFCLIGSMVFIGLSFNAPELLIRFLLVGELPGHNTPLSADTMLTITLIGLALTVIVFAPRVLIRAALKLHTTKLLRLPHSRYSSIQ